MGGVFAPIDFHGVALGPGRDFNLVTDPDASVTSLNAGFAIRYVPLDVTFRTVLRDEHVRRLRGVTTCAAPWPRCVTSGAVASTTAPAARFRPTWSRTSTIR